MILIEIEGGGVPRFRLEFHPRLTVVAGLDEVQRRELAQAIVNVLRGSGKRMKLNVDIGGVPQPYTYDTVLSTGMDKLPFDNVVTPAAWRAEQEKAHGLLGAPVVPQAPVFTRSPAPRAIPNAVVEVEPQHGVDVESPEEALAKADRQLQVALAQVQALEAQLEALAPAPPPVDSEELGAARTAVEVAQAEVDGLQARLDDSGDPAAAGGIDPVEELEQLTSLKAAIERRLANLRSALEDLPGDVAAITSALDDALRSAEILREREEFKSLLGAAGGEWNRNTMEIGRLLRHPRPPEWLILQAKDQLEDATARVTALTYQMQEGIEVREPLARAHKKLLEAQAGWDEIEHGIEGKVAAAEAERSQMHEKITALLGREVRHEQVLEALALQHEEIQTQPHPAQRLVDELENAGVNAGLDDAVHKAQELLRARAEMARGRDDSQRQLATAMVDLRDVTHGIEAARARLDSAQEPEPGLDELRVRHGQAAVVLSEARRRLALLQDQTADFAGYDPNAGVVLRQQLDTAHAAAAVAQQELEAASLKFSATTGSDEDLNELGEAADDAIGDASGEAFDEEPGEEAESSWGRPWWEGGLTLAAPEETPSGPVAELDVYLLSRVAALRMLVRGESIPLIVDGVLEGLPAAEAGRVLEALAKVSSVVQVIYLASSADAAEKWAKRQEIFTTAVVRLERA